MKRFKLIKNLSNILFIIGAAMCALALYLIISTRASLPPGVCPADNYQPLTIAAIVVLVTSLVLSFAADAIKKRIGENKEDKESEENNENQGGDDANS